MRMCVKQIDCARDNGAVRGGGQARFSCWQVASPAAGQRQGWGASPRWSQEHSTQQPCLQSDDRSRGLRRGCGLTEGCSLGSLSKWSQKRQTQRPVKSKIFPSPGVRFPQEGVGSEGVRLAPCSCPSGKAGHEFGSLLRHLGLS